MDALFARERRRMTMRRGESDETGSNEDADGREQFEQRERNAKGVLPLQIARLPFMHRTKHGMPGLRGRRAQQ